MKPPRLGLIVLILGAVVLGSYLLSNVFQKQTAKSLVSYPSIKLSSPELSLPAPQASSFDNFDEKNNLTKAFGDNLYQQIRAGSFSTATDLPSEEFFEKFINDSLANFQLISSIDDSEIKISPDNSSEAKNQYLKTLKEISIKNNGDFKENYLQIIINTYQNLDRTSATRLADIYKNLANDYLSLAAPKDWADIHKQLIIYAKNAETIYRAMADHPIDPFRGFLALESIDSLVDSAQKIQIILGEKIKEVTL